jgi:hypothetical protein
MWTVVQYSQAVEEQLDQNVAWTVVGQYSQAVEWTVGQYSQAV